MRQLTLWFLRRFRAFRELERRLLVLGGPSEGFAPKGTVARAEQEALLALYKVVPAQIEVVLLPSKTSQEVGPGQIGLQLVEGVHHG